MARRKMAMWKCDCPKGAKRSLDKRGRLRCTSKRTGKQVKRTCGSLWR